MPRRKADIILEKIALELEHKKNPEARAEVKRLGLEVGKLVRYSVEGVEHRGVVSKLHHKSVEIVMTGHLLGENYKNVVIREDTIPFAGVLEILGDGRLPERPPPEAKKWPPPPPRTKGYEECEIGKCAARPSMAYRIQSYDKETKMLGPPRIIAVCKQHDEKYEEASNPNKGGIMQTPAHIPLVWQIGVPSDSWRIPPPEGTKIETGRVPPPPKPKKKEAADRVSSPRPLTNSPYEGVKGRHPKLCDCSRHGA